MATPDLVALIHAKQAAIAKLQAELDKARALLNGSMASRVVGEPRPVPLKADRPTRPAPRDRRVPVVAFKPESSVGLAVQVLKDAGTPLHVNELIERIGKLGHKVNKLTLVGNISRYIKKRVVFYRAKPSVFGLVDWQGARST